MRFCLLASGSKGNAIWIEDSGRAVVIDMGLSYKEFARRAKLAGLDVSLVKALIISHEHSDHTGGVGPVARKLSIPVWASENTPQAAQGRLDNVKLNTFQAGDELDFDFIGVKTVISSHDAANPVVFVINGRKVKLGLATDLGTVTTLVFDSLKDADALILEFNHDFEMLLNGPYPYFLKQRVRSRHGHLSNEQAAEILKDLVHKGTKRVVLAHLSETNNTPQLARQAAHEVLSRLPYSPSLSVAGQWEPTEVFEL
jgi:phosphoribosyl 1,2-cyclic phosphodiesterase